MFNYAVIKPYTITDNISNVPNLMGKNYKVLKKKVFLHLGYTDIDYAIRKYLKCLSYALY